MNFREIYEAAHWNMIFERVCREAVEEALVSEEKSAHERHAPKKDFEWYYFGGSAENINEELTKHESSFNKDYNDTNGNVIRYHSYKITDDKTKEVIGWLNYITKSSKDEQGNTVKSINSIKLKQETPGSQDTCFQQAIKYLVSKLQTDNVSSITWEAANDSKNPLLKRYESLCQRLGGSSKIAKDNKSIIFSIPREAFIKSKDMTLKYFRLN